MKEELRNISAEKLNMLHSVMPAIVQDMNVEQVTDLLDLTDKGMVRNSVTNAELILSYDPLLREGIRYNELTQRIDIVKQMGWERINCGSALTDNDLYNIHLYCNRTYGINTLAIVEEAVQIVANRNAFHPIRDYLSGLRWDGQERIRYALHHFLGAEVSDYSYEILKLFMLGAVSRVFRPGCKFDYILCLVGGQGVGKSSFSRLRGITDEWFTDDLKDMESAKVYEKMQGHWIIELSEMLATNNAKSNEAVKSFLTRQRETYRTPYEKYPKDRPRQCVFMGTTNKIMFLPNDRTGNRRFLPIRCEEDASEVFILDNEKESRAYIVQMWAEIMEIYRRKDFKLKLTPEMEAEVKRRQKEFMQEDVDAGLIIAYMDDFTGDRVCSKQLFKEALHNEFVKPARWQTNEINEIMNQLIRDGTLTGWRYFSSPKRFGSEYGTQKGWERIPGVYQEASTEDRFVPVPEQMEIPFEK